MANQTNSSKIFISFSGEIGKQIAVLIKEYITKATKNTELAYVSVVSNKTGDKWFEKYSKEIKDSSIYIGIITDDYFDSFYATSELAISLTIPKIKYLIFKIGKHVKFPENTVESSHIAKIDLDDNPTEKIIGDVFDNIKSSLKDYSSKETKASVKRIENSLTIILDKIKYSYTDEIHEVKSLIEEVKNYSLIAIKKNKPLVASDPVKQNYIDTAVAVLKYSNDIIKTIAEKNEIKVNLPWFVTNFWSDNIIRRVKSNIWTTNLKGTHGRSNNAELIKVQSETFIKKGIGKEDERLYITRVFVYDEIIGKRETKDIDEKNSKDISDLQIVTYSQLTKIVREVEDKSVDPVRYRTERIKNYIIEESEFKKFKSEIVNLGYQEDFMIIDNSYSYLTIPDKNSELVSEGLWKPIINGYELRTNELQSSIINKSKEVTFDEEKGETNFISLFEKTENVRNTELFFKKHGITYCKLSRNAFAHDCEQAASVRYRTNKVGISLCEELKTHFGYYMKANGEKHLVVVNCSGDKNVHWKSINRILQIPDLKKDEELIKKFKIQFAAVNPFLISSVYDKTPAIKHEYKTLTILYDESLTKITSPMHTNAGELSWGIEFMISDVLKIDNTRIKDQNFIYDKSFIKTA